MEDKLKAYIQTQAASPPKINERLIIKTLQKRRKRFSLIMLSIAGTLWTILLYSAALWVGKEFSQNIAIFMLFCLTLGYICAGCFAGIVVKFRKVGFYYD
ncbi:MAG: hypothetical protein LBM65_00135 [Oscillospiraceae bacterium]|jgi:uncharacterized membrane protein|nr:hypothetical protein [Oscillospiraceae bacterium]